MYNKLTLLRFKTYFLSDNLHFWMKTVPEDQWVTLIQLLKSGSKSDLNNYWQFSLLPALSIFLIVSKRLVSHFNRYRLFHSEKYGFIKDKYITDAGIALMKNDKTFTEYNAWANSRNVIGVFCDLSKASDCIDHEIFVRKLSHYGIKSKSLDLIKS